MKPWTPVVPKDAPVIKRQQPLPADVEELVSQLGGLSLERDFWAQTALRVQSSDPNERFLATKQFRVMLSVSGDIPIQEVVDTGIVPHLVALAQDFDYPPLQFEAAWALTNIASGTRAQTATVVETGGISAFLKLLLHEHEEIVEQGLWGLGNIAGDRPEYRDIILKMPPNTLSGKRSSELEAVSLAAAMAHPDQFVMRLIVLSCGQRKVKLSTLRTGVWCISNLCRGQPRPLFVFIAPAIRFLASILENTNDETVLIDSCWALDGLSEHQDGVTMLVNEGILPKLKPLLMHDNVAIQRPILRVIGQVAAGSAEQTSAVMFLLPELRALLNSPHKSIRKDACWTLSNIAAGTPAQLQALMDTGDLLTKLLDLCLNDVEPDARKEAAWVLCVACTSHRPQQLDMLIALGCLQPVCEMLSVDDVRMLDVAVEALENILEHGARRSPTGVNVCAELARQCDAGSRLKALHIEAGSAPENFALWQKAERLWQKWMYSVRNPDDMADSSPFRMHMTSAMSY